MLMWVGIESKTYHNNHQQEYGLNTKILMFAMGWWGNPILTTNQPNWIETW